MPKSNQTNSFPMLRMRAVVNRPWLSIRVCPENPNHHLFSNHGTWWVHYTLHFPNGTVERIRSNLRTRSLKIARQRRDSILENGLFQDRCPGICPRKGGEL